MNYIERQMREAVYKNKKADTTVKYVFIFLFAAVFFDCMFEAWILLAVHIFLFEINLETTRRRIISFRDLVHAYNNLQKSLKS